MKASKIRSNLYSTFLIMLLSGCSNEPQPGIQSLETNENSLSKMFSQSARSCEGNQAQTAVANSIYSEFGSNDRGLADSIQNMELMFEYSSNTIDILKTSNFNELVQGCLIDGEKMKIFLTSDECHELRKEQNSFGDLAYENVKNIPNINTKFSEFITLSESMEDGILECKIKFIVTQDSNTENKFSRSTSWININLSVYDKKTSDGSYYTEYSFIDKNQNYQDTYYRRLEPRDLRTMTGGTGVRE